MAYIGTSPSNGVRRIHTYTATAGQTTFTGSSTEGVTLTYADTNYIDVFQNGVLLGSADYTSTSGTSVVLAQGASVSDLVVIVVYDVFSVADTVSKTSGGSFDSGVTMSSTLDVTGALTGTIATLTTADNSDNLTLTSTDADASNAPNLNLFRNSSSPADNDFLANIKFNGRNDNSQDVQYSEIEVYATDVSDGTEDGLYNVNVITGGSNKSYLQMSGANGIVFNEDSNDIDFRVESNGNANMLFVDAGNDRIGIGTNTPTSDAQTTMSSSSNQTFLLNMLQSSSSGLGFSVGVTSGLISYFYNNASRTAIVGSISHNGSSTAYNTSSDHRLKESVTYDFDATTRLKQLKPARFNFIADETNTLVDGFLAHEVQAIVPECVTGTHNEVDDDGNAVMQGIDQSKLVPLLVKTIQELEARITALESGE